MTSWTNSTPLHCTHCTDPQLTDRTDWILPVLLLKSISPGCILSLTHPVKSEIIRHFVCPSIRYHGLGLKVLTEAVLHSSQVTYSWKVSGCVQSSQVAGLKVLYNHHTSYRKLNPGNPLGRKELTPENCSLISIYTGCWMCMPCPTLTINKQVKQSIKKEIKLDLCFFSLCLTMWLNAYSLLGLLVNLWIMCLCTVMLFTCRHYFPLSISMVAIVSLNTSL
jgi:hypothetical protein